MPAVKFQCPNCAQPLEAPEEAARLKLNCPSCQAEIEVPAPGAVPAPATAPSSPTAPVPPSSGPRCAFCLTSIAGGETTTTCPTCQASYHAECWTENGGCAVYGCSSVPVVESRRAIEIPVSYWGRENKPCPACGREILAAAVRCRHCGATFDTARPQDAAEFQERTNRDQRLPGTRKKVVWLFLFCVIPCLSPIGAVWGAVWYPTHKEDVNSLPSLYPALCKIGLGVAVVQVVAMVVLAVLYSVLRGGLQT